MPQAILAIWALLWALVSAGSDGAWQPVGLGGSGGMFTLAVSGLDPRLMLVNCDMSGVYLTRDGGQTWQLIHHRLLHGNTRCAPLFDPAVPGRIYAVSGETDELRVSEDAGVTWTPFATVPFLNIQRLAFDPARPREIILTTFGSSILRGPAEP